MKILIDCPECRNLSVMVEKCSVCDNETLITLERLYEVWNTRKKIVDADRKDYSFRAEALRYRHLLQEIYPKIRDVLTHEDPNTIYTAEEAIDLMNHGIWMASKAYTWRNYEGYGQYWAHGPFPKCIRECQLLRIDDVRKVSDEWKRATVPTSNED